MSFEYLNGYLSAEDWDNRWKKIFNHYQHDIRHAHYIRALINNDEKNIFEIGAGSFRDMAALRQRSINCSGGDFSQESVRMARTMFPGFANNIYCVNAFSTGFADMSFDLTYHNGFWSCFDDGDIKLLAKEQARITRKRMIATVHNVHNKQFFDYFEKMKVSDSIYDVRFFSVDEIFSLMQNVCDNIVIIPVGKGKRLHEDVLIRFGLTNPLLIRTYLKLSGHRFLGSSERLLSIGTVRR
jgi:hypothetical protein